LLRLSRASLVRHAVSAARTAHGVVLLLMMLTAVGNWGFLIRAHLQHRTEGTQAVDRDTAPIAQSRLRAEGKVKALEERRHKIEAELTKPQ
jgi:hypothetical protein